jgi:hypothetical protein
MTPHDWTRIPSGTAYPLYRCGLCRLAVELRNGEDLAALDRYLCGPQQEPPPPDPRAVSRRYQEAARERWTEEIHRPLDQVLASIDRLTAAGLLPACGCPDTVQAVLTDLLTPGRWRKEWGDGASSAPDGILDARLSTCRACPEFADPNDVARVYCQRDMGVAQDGSPCVRVAVQRWAGRIGGAERPCERHAI